MDNGFFDLCYAGRGSRICDFGDPLKGSVVILKQQTQSFLVGNEARVCYLEEDAKQSTTTTDEKPKHKNGKTEHAEVKSAAQAKTVVRGR